MKIAREKAGVIHRGGVVLTSNDDRDVIEVLRRRAAKFDSRFIAVSGEHDSPLVGPFQRRNAALAVRTAEELRAVLPKITPQSIERGSTSVAVVPMGRNTTPSRRRRISRRCP